MKMTAMTKIFTLYLWSFTVFTGCSSTLIKVSDRIRHENAGRHAIAFAGVNIIPMASDSVLTDQTLIIRNGVIEAMGNSSQTVIPAGSFIIDARGKYLLPGFIDMHVHISDDEDLLLLLAHGVTGVRNMADLPGWVKTFMGFSDAVVLRNNIRDGKIIGPDIYTSGLVLDGTPPVSPFNKEVRTKEEITAEIEHQKKINVDFIKIYDMLTPEHYFEILRLAKLYSIPVAGHVPFSISIDTVLKSDIRSIEHLSGFINNNKSDFIIPETMIGEYARKTKQNGIYNCPTLVVWDKLPPEHNLDTLQSYKEYKYVSWKLKWLWGQTMSAVYDIDPALKIGYAAHMMDISKQMTRALNEEQCKLLVGTDMDFVGVFPGSSTLREIELLVEAGVKPIDALKAATVNAAECLGREELFGSVAPGKRADLLLLEKNPLEDIRNVHSTAGVMVHGLWIEKEQIDRFVAELE